MAIPRFPQGPFSGDDLDTAYALEPPYPTTPPSGVTLSTSTPLVESGAGAVGTQGAASHGDHVHPAIAGGVPATTVTGPDALGATAVVGVGTKYARDDHDHGLPAATAPVAEALGSTVVTGASGVAADASHRHAMPAKSVAVPLANSGAGSAGTSANPSLDDHVHPASSGVAPTNAIIATDETQLGVNTWTDLATPGPAVTVTVPASGIVQVTVTVDMVNALAGYSAMGFALSGANTVAATDVKAALVGAATTQLTISATYLLTGLTPGATTFTAKYNQFGTGGTSHYKNREIIVQPF